MKILVGLGNPGQEYQATRHNIGFWVVETLARKLDLKWSERICRSRLCRGKVFGQEIIMAKPHTFMNRSGSACLCLQNKEEIDPGDFLIIYDDLDLEPGQMRLRKQGSSGGHRGMGSIINVLGTREIPRLRMGIGRPIAAEEPREYVLKPLRKTEQKEQQEHADKAVEGLLVLLEEGFDPAMSFLNKRSDSD